MLDRIPGSRMLALAVSLLACLSCSDGDSDGNGTTADEDSGTADVTVVAGSELVGLYAFDSATTPNGTLTTRYQAAPGAGQPDRQVRAAGGLIVREDGSYDRIIKFVYRQSTDAEPAVDESGGTEIISGTWSVEARILTIQDEGEEAKEFNYNLANSTGLLTLDIVTADEDTPEQMVWRSAEVASELVGNYVFVSSTLNNGATITTTNADVGGDQYRGEGTLEVLDDGLFTRNVVFFVNDTPSGSDDSGEGMWFVDGSVLTTEQADQDTLTWDFTYDEATGVFTQNSQDPDFEAQQLVWMRPSR